MVRVLLAVIAGLVLGGVVVAAVQSLNYLLFPAPPGLDPHKPEDLAKLMAQIPLAALLMVELSYVAGSLVAGFVAGKIAARRPALVALILGVALTGFNLLNLAQIPHPLWMALLTTATFLPLTWLGGRLAAPRVG